MKPSRPDKKEPSCPPVTNTCPPLLMKQVQRNQREGKHPLYPPLRGKRRASLRFGIHFLNYDRPGPSPRTAPAKSANAWLTHFGASTGAKASSTRRRPPS